MPQFSPGEILRGRILERIDPQLAVMELNGKNLFAQTRVPLPLHTNLTFQVAQSHPTLILKLISEGDWQEPSLAPFIKNLFAKDVPMGILLGRIASLGQMGFDKRFLPIQEALGNFWDFLRRFALPDLPSDGANPWRQILAQSGLLWESKVRQLIEGHQERLWRQKVQEDMKGLALRLRYELKNLSLPINERDENFMKVEEWVRGLDQFLGKIETYQILNLWQAHPREKIFLLFPFWFDHRPQFIELNLRLPQRQSTHSDAEEVTLLFLLHLPELGKMKIEVKIRGKELFCRFTTSDPQKSRWIRQPLLSLAERMKRLGFHSHMDVGEEPFEQENPIFISQTEKSPASLLNLKV